jgi:hypothetical protein
MERSEGKSMTSLFVIQTTLERIFDILEEGKFELFESDGMVVFRMNPNTADGYSIEYTKKYCCFLVLKGTTWMNRVDIPLDIDPKDILGLLDDAILKYTYPPEKENGA